MHFSFSPAVQSVRFRVRFPHPLWVLAAPIVLLAIAGALKLGVRVYCERAAIRQIELRGGKCYAVRSLPEWVYNSFGADFAEWFEPVHSVVFQDVPLGDDDLSILVGLSRVERLGLHNVPVTDACFSQLGRLPSLHEIELVRVPITGEGLRELRGRTPLKSLFMLGCPMTEAGLAEIARLPLLESLSLIDDGRDGNDSPPITDAGLAALMALPALTHVCLESPEITDESLCVIGQMHSLTRLRLAKARISDAGLAELRGLVRLEWLALNVIEGISDAGLEPLASLKNLSHLELAGTSITDRGLPRLHELTHLSDINLNGARVTPAGIAELTDFLPQLYVAADHLQSAPESIEYLPLGLSPVMR